MLGRLKTILAASGPGATGDSLAQKIRGDAHLKRDAWDDAARCYRTAVSIDPNYVDACVGLGFVLRTQGKYREAERYLRHALSLDSRNADAHYLLGTILRETGDRDGAIGHLSKALDIKPDLEVAYRDLFLVLFQDGRTEDARDVITKAVSRFPGSAEFHFYLGHVLDREERYDESIACYQHSLSMQPGSAQTHNNLGDVFRKCGRLDEASACYRKAISITPDHVDAHANLGSIMQTQGKIDDAIACYQRAVSLKPGYAAAHQCLGNAFLERGETARALACFNHAFKLDPDNGVGHLIAALSGSESERAPSRYVENLFDGYASKFDTHLVQVLAYDTPEKLIALVRQFGVPEIGSWDVLDLGCGTGLSGLAIAPYARQLVGVDLSGKMLEKARARNLYHRLEQGDLMIMMQSEAASSYDMVFAADVLIYLGNLSELVTQVRRVLRPGGLFAFSVESLEALSSSEGAVGQRDFRLNLTGRYAHSIAYLNRMAAEERFDVLTTVDTHVRLEKGRPVEGYMALWRRLGD